MRVEERLIKFRNNVIGGSPTSSKQQAAAEFAENLGMDAIESMATGGMQSVPRRAISGAVRTLNVNMTDKSAAKVVDILYEVDPKKKLDIMKQLTKTSEGQKVVKAALESMDSIRMLRVGRQELEKSLNPETVGLAAGVTMGRQTND